MAYIEDKIRAIIMEKLSVKEDEVVPEASLKDLSADSLDTVEIIMEFEQEFDLRIPDEDMEKFGTIGDIVNYIGEHKPNLKS